MPTPAKPAQPSPTHAPPTGPQQAPSRAAPARHGAPTIVLKKSNERWTYMIHPMALTCIGGHIVPDVAKVYDTPGLNGNGKDSTGKGARVVMAAQGYVEVPDIFECVAFGQHRGGAGSSGSSYLDIYQMHDDRGQLLHTWYSDAWTQLYMVGNVLAKRRDEPGWQDFLRRCLTLVAPDGLDPAQVEAATTNLFRDVRATAMRDDSRSKHRLAVLLTHVPREYAPADIRAIMEPAKASA